MSRSALVTTDTELKAIAAPAKTGDKNPAAARGIPSELYTSAQNRFNIAHGSFTQFDSCYKAIQIASH